MTEKINGHVFTGSATGADPCIICGTWADEALDVSCRPSTGNRLPEREGALWKEIFALRDMVSHLDDEARASGEAAVLAEDGRRRAEAEVKRLEGIALNYNLIRAMEVAQVSFTNKNGIIFTVEPDSDPECGCDHQVGPVMWVQECRFSGCHETSHPVCLACALEENEAWSCDNDR